MVRTGGGTMLVGLIEDILSWVITYHVVVVVIRGEYSLILISCCWIWQNKT